MANLLSTIIDGFISSRNFVSGLLGSGWRINNMNGKSKAEFDDIVIRNTMTVFELLISKIRAIKGALGITQASGKIKSVRSDDNNFYIEIEDEMSFVANDIIRCMEFNNNQRSYWVIISAVDGKEITVAKSEFNGVEPQPADELVQFGNTTDTRRQSAIYLHADENGQPSIDVLFGINSKTFDGCTKVRVGGDIPGTDGLRGFYCENGMVKGVNEAGELMYCLYPDGQAYLGAGSAIFRPDKSGYIADGAISWQWDETKKKYVCTMGDVILTWENLSEEVREKLKGEPGQDANMLEWVKEWNGTHTTINGKSIVSPKGYFGIVTDNRLNTGVLIGHEVLETGKSGIYGIKNDQVVFKLDSEGNNILGGWSIEKDALDCKSDKAKLNVDITSIDYLHLNSTAAFLEISTSNKTKGCLLLHTHSGFPAIEIVKDVLMTEAIRAFGAVRIDQGDNNSWDTPGCLMAMTIVGRPDGITVKDGWDGPISSGTVTRLDTGVYRVTHNLGHDNYVPMAISSYLNNSGNGRCNYITNITEKTSTYFTIKVSDNKDNKDDCTLYVTMFGRNKFRM